MSQSKRATEEIGAAEEPIMRTAGGDIDLQAYLERVHAARAEAHRDVMAAMIKLWRAYRAAYGPAAAARRTAARP